MWLYIVLFLHQTTTLNDASSQLKGCISYYSYIKPQRLSKCTESIGSCISYYSYIKPQHNNEGHNHKKVVYRTIPTSNHNTSSMNIENNLLYIVLFLHQTTTAAGDGDYGSQLYIVLFLHQTTTNLDWRISWCLLYIVLFLHQTTTYTFIDTQHFSCISYYSYIKPQRRFRFAASRISCISYYSYIKPQLYIALCLYFLVVYRTIPTSNHNW